MNRYEIQIASSPTGPLEKSVEKNSSRTRNARRFALPILGASMAAASMFVSGKDSGNIDVGEAPIVSGNPNKGEVGHTQGEALPDEDFLLKMTDVFTRNASNIPPNLCTSEVLARKINATSIFKRSIPSTNVEQWANGYGVVAQEIQEIAEATGISEFGALVADLEAITLEDYKKYSPDPQLAIENWRENWLGVSNEVDGYCALTP